MLKKILNFVGAASAVLFLCPILQADSGHIVYDNYLPIPNPVAYSSTFSVRADGINWASAQIVVTSVTQGAAPTFNDGGASTASITVADYTSLSTAAATGSITVSTTASLAGTAGSGTIVISSNVLGTIVTILGPPPYGSYAFTVGNTVAQGFASSNTAVNFVSAINALPPVAGLVASTSTTTNVLISCVSSGTFCNAYSVTSSSGAAVSTAAFSGGVNPATFTFNTGMFQANSQWAVGVSSNATALNIAAALNAGYMGTLVLATTGTLSNVVTITSLVPGSLANTYGLTSGISSITVSGATLTGGHDNATICVNQTCLTANAATSSFTATTSNNATAASIAGSFSNSVASQTVSFGAASAVIGATTTAVGASTNYALLTSTQGALTISPFTSSGPVNSAGIGGAVGAMYGGFNSSYTINGSVIFSTGSPLALAQGVWFSTSVGATGLSPLVIGTTYYAIPGASGSGTFQLALTSTGALAGVPIVLTSSAVKTTPDVFNLNFPTGTGGAGAPGQSGVSWAVSNDQVHWVLYNLTPFNIAIGSVTYPASGYNGATGVVNNYDFGHMDYGYLGLSVTASTAAPTTVGAHIIGKAP